MSNKVLITHQLCLYYYYYYLNDKYGTPKKRKILFEMCQKWYFFLVFLQVESFCPPDWLELENKCIKRLGVRKTFDQALNICKRRKSEIFVPQAEFNFHSIFNPTLSGFDILNAAVFINKKLLFLKLSSIISLSEFWWKSSSEDIFNFLIFRGN